MPTSTNDARQVFLDSLGGELLPSDSFLFRNSYPTHTLTCASEIFNIWVCRMIMLGYHFTGKPPFEHMFVHAVARDEKGRKMSKSLGNGIDPNEMLEKYSADSLRMALNSLIVPGRDALLSQKSAEELIVKWRNFGNKLWNVSRFIYDQEAQTVTNQEFRVSSASGWIWEKLDLLGQSINQNMAVYRLGQVMDDIYHFVWDDLASWYIEYLKTAPDQIIFAKKHVFEPLLKLIHPFVPFETEAIWIELSALDPTLNPKNKLLLEEQFNLPRIDLKLFNSQEFENIIDFVNQFRQLRGLYRIDPVLKLKINSKNLLIQEYSAFLGLIARIELDTEVDGNNSSDLFAQKWGGIEFSFDLKNVIPDLAIELNRTKEDLIKTENDILKLEKLLSNPGFVAKAGEETVEKTKTELNEKLEFKLQLQTKVVFLK